MALLRDIDRGLALFAEGIAGRPQHVKSLRELPNAAPEDAVDAVHDGRSLYLPEAVGHFADERRNEGAYRALALERLGFREFGTYRFDMATARERIAALADWPPPVDAGEPHLAVFFKGFPRPDIARRLFRAIETARVRLAMETRYPGARRYRPADAVAALRLALERITPQSEDLRLLVAPACTVQADVYTSAMATVACAAALNLPGETGDAPLAEAGPAFDALQREARLEDWDEDLAAAESQVSVLELALRSDEVQAGQGEAEDGSLREAGADLVIVAAERDRRKRRLAAERAAVRRALGDERHGERSFRYDEWDYAQGVYLRGWCRLYEKRLDHEDGDGADLLGLIAPHAKAVRRRFEQVRPAGYQRVKKTPDGEELDLDAIVEARSDIRVGVSPDERVHSRRERLRRDVAAAFLVDLSASTDDVIEDADPSGEPGNGPAATQDAAAQDIRDPYFDDDNYDFAARMAAEAAKRRVIDIEREAALLMAVALEGLGDRYAVYGFSGYGRDCVEFSVAKEFDEPLDRRAVRAIAAMKPQRSTRMGPAVRHAAGKLVASGAALKVLMIVSDGFPQDHDYGPTRGDHEHGVQDTAKALREAEARGVETFCVTVDRSGHDYLRRMCPAHRYMVIEETSDLPEALQVAYRQLTRI